MKSQHPRAAMLDLLMRSARCTSDAGLLEPLAVAFVRIFGLDIFIYLGSGLRSEV